MNLTFGKRLKALRLFRGMTLMEVAEIVGCSANTISNYERDKMEPSFFNVVCIADALGTTLNFLAGKEKFEETFEI